MSPDDWYDEYRLALSDCTHYFYDKYLSDLLTKYRKLLNKVYDTPEKRELDCSSPLKSKIEFCFVKAGVSIVPYMISSDVSEEQYEKTLDIFIKFLIEEGGR